MLRWPSGVTAIRQEAVEEPLACGGRREGDAIGVHGFRENAAQPVIEHFAHEEAITAQRGQACHGVGGGTARHFVKAAERLAVVGQRLVQLFGPELIDQGHAALGDAMGEEKTVIHRGDHIHDRIAQGGDIVFFAHAR